MTSSSEPSTKGDARTPIASRRIPDSRQDMTPEDHEAAQVLIALMRTCDDIRANRATGRKAA